MKGKRASPSWLEYQPSGRRLDVEVVPFDDLRHRSTPKEIQAAYRYAFHMLICVTDGSVTQLVDFEPVDCLPGSLLVIRPGQVHSFGNDLGWEGWLVMFRAEFLPSVTETASALIPALGLDRLADHLTLATSEFSAMTEAISRMKEDAQSRGKAAEVHALLRHQLSALLLRLAILQDRIEASQVDTSRALKRYARFRTLLEQNHSGWHQVADYAAVLGCTEKSLTRATLEATGRSAKDVIAARLMLEAKRLLAHTDRPVYLIAESLGFDEATNFSKFFRREARQTPLEFRNREHVGSEWIGLIGPLR